RIRMEARTLWILPSEVDRLFGESSSARASRRVGAATADEPSPTSAVGTNVLSKLDSVGARTSVFASRGQAVAYALAGCVPKKRSPISLVQSSRPAGRDQDIFLPWDKFRYPSKKD